MPKKKFSKPALSINQQIDFLSQQGMKIEDADLAASVLSVVSCYRLSAYLLPFKLPHQNNKPRRFKSNTTFDQIWQLYQFDRELRLLVSDAIEKIEVAFRTVLVNVTCLEFEPFWYVESSHFKNPRQHANLLKNIDEIR